MTAASEVSAAIEKDSVVGLIGTNGAGKTTFINMITGYLKPDRGSIAYEGRDITRLPPRDITRLGICRSFQIPQLYGSLIGVRQHDDRHRHRAAQCRPRRLLLARRGARCRATASRPRRSPSASSAASACSSTASRNAQVLPGGARKLLDIALAMVARPRILLLDEPTSGVSSQEKFGIMQMVLEAVRAEGATVLFVEHDMEVVSRFAQRVLAFYDGRIIADAPPRGRARRIPRSSATWSGRTRA